MPVTMGIENNWDKRSINTNFVCPEKCNVKEYQKS